MQDDDTTSTLEHTCESSLLGDIPCFKAPVPPILSGSETDISLITANKNKDSSHMATEKYFFLAR